MTWQTFPYESNTSSVNVRPSSRSSIELFRRNETLDSKNDGSSFWRSSKSGRRPSKSLYNDWAKLI